MDTGKFFRLFTRDTRVSGDTNQAFSATLFIDCGCKRTFISEELTQKLQLKTIGVEHLKVHVFASKTPQTMESRRVKVNLVQKNGQPIEIEANVPKCITNHKIEEPLSSEDLQYLNQRYSKGEFRMEILEAGRSVKPDILIGQDYAWDIIKMKRDQLPSGLCVLDSKIGPLIGGQEKELQKTTYSSEYALEIQREVNQCVAQLTTNSITPTPLTTVPNMEDFWSLESIGIHDITNQDDDKLAMQRFNDTITMKNRRYCVGWPWKTNEVHLHRNFRIALGRFRMLLRKFRSDTELFAKYSKIITDQLEKGVIEPVDPDIPTSNVVHYLPHHPIITPDKSTTKVRVVYDASSTSGRTENSLNDCLLKGPSMIPDLCGMLMRFRLPKIVMIADIEKAFLQIELQDSDRDSTRFLWLRDPGKLTLEDNLLTLRFTRVAFGVISSPFLLNATVRHHLLHQESEMAHEIAANIYVDNVIAAASTPQYAKEIYREVKIIFSDGCMNLREWLSNCQEFNSSLPECDKVKSSTTKVLGMVWDSTTDTITLPLENASRNTEMTKRGVTQIIASVFDPLGVVTPVTLAGKLFLQKVWSCKCEWDESLPEAMQQEWRQIHSSYEELRQIILPRHYGVRNNDDETYELHAFVDASKMAYATVVYLRVHSTDQNVQTVLLFTKSRVAPKKQLSLPRLELMVLLIGTRAIKFCEEQLRMQIQKKYIWSDSECVLSGIKSQKTLKVFVENRIKEIRNTTNTTFRYVNTSENSADLATRGCSANELSINQEWWHGPAWMSLSETAWPSSNIPPLTSEKIAEIETEHRETPIYVNVGLTRMDDVINIDAYSRLDKLLRVTAYCLKFVNKMLWNKLSTTTKSKYPRLEIIMGHDNRHKYLKPIDVKQATNYWEHQTQQTYFKDFLKALNNGTKNQPVQQLRLFVDETGLIRCQNRLMNSEMSVDAKYPILLPAKSSFTDLVIMRLHEQFIHSGIQHTLSSLRERYWIPRGRQIVRRVIKSCHTCVKIQGGPFSRPRMPPFPKERVNRCAPFRHIGLDYMGPFLIKDTDSIQKAWICLFTCMNTRAVHLEPVTDCTAHQFLNSLRRFISRRGKPSLIISDNALQFKLAQRVVEEAWNTVQNDPDVISYCAATGIDWYNIVEYAPWQGGFYERLIGMSKCAFKKAVGRKKLTLEEMFTVCPEIEAMLNTRPLIYVSDDVHSNRVLRPVDFIHTDVDLGTPYTNDNPTDPDYLPVVDSVDKLTTLWHKQQEILDKFWNTWQIDSSSPQSPRKI